MRMLSPQEFHTEVEPIVRRIFRPIDTAVHPDLQRLADAGDGYMPDWLYEPFLPAIERRGAISNIINGLTKHQCRALAVAATAVGESGFYVYVAEAGITERALLDFPPRFFTVDTEADIEQFVWEYGAIAVAANAMVAPTGRWGLLTSRGDHAVIGGTEQDFVDSFYTAWGTTAEQQAREFLRGYEPSIWLNNLGRDPGFRGDPGREEKCGWVPILLRHLYGEELATRFIAEARSS